jgi:aminomethyltransferase
LKKASPLYGNDIDDTLRHWKPALAGFTKFPKEFTARPILEQQKAEGLTRKLVGIEMIDKGIPAINYRIQNAAGEDIGYVTSGTQSPRSARLSAWPTCARISAMKG